MSKDNGCNVTDAAGLVSGLPSASGLHLRRWRERWGGGGSGGRKWASGHSYRSLRATMSYRDRDYGDRDRGGYGGDRGGYGGGGGAGGPRDPPTGCSLLIRNLSYDTT